MYTGRTSDLHIDHRTQLFFDNLMIESAQDLTRRMHRPRKVEDGPLLTADQPWETISYICCNTWNVLWDEADGLFKCWYVDWQYKGGLFWDKVDPFRLLYAYSEDGVHWSKPALGLRQEGGHDTNIVLGGDQKCWKVFGTSVFIDPLDPDPSRRFKTLFDHIAPPADSLWGSREVRAAHSPDGIHWTVYEERPTCGTRGQLFDDIIVLTVDTEARQYVAYTRHSYRGDFAPYPSTPRTNSLWSPHYPHDPGRENRAGVWVSVSSDFLHWSEPRPILHLDENDNLDDQAYCLAPLDLGSHRVGLLNVLHTVENTIDVQLVHSRDGVHWQRAGQRQPFLERGVPGSWDESSVNVASLPVRVEDELWIYYGGARNHHDWWFLAEDEGLDVLEARNRSLVGYAMGLAKLRLDGFVSLQAGPVREGILVTRPFISDGTRLVINGACEPGGYIDVEVVDINDEVLSGRSRADCDTFRDDSVRHVVTWGEQSFVPVPTPPGILYERAGSPYGWAGHRKLRFYMRNAHLFSFRLERG